MGSQLGFYDALLVMLAYGNAMRRQILEDGIKQVHGIVILQQNRWASLSRLICVHPLLQFACHQVWSAIGRKPVDGVPCRLVVSVSPFPRHFLPLAAALAAGMISVHVASSLFSLSYSSICVFIRLNTCDFRPPRSRKSQR